jgi:hypothetical protein
MTMRDGLGTGYLLLPLLGGGIFHGLCMKFGWLAVLKRPIDGGRTLRGRRLFGANKTIRGVVAVGIGTAILLGVQAELLHRLPSVRAVELFDYSRVNGWLLGFLVGAAAMCAELPNSFVKRQLDVRPGDAARGTIGLVLYLVDQVDLLVGAWLAFALILDVRLVWVLWSVVIVAVVHQLLTTVTYALGMRASSR